MEKVIVAVILEAVSLICNQHCLAGGERSVEQLQAELAAAQKEICELDAPVFKNLREIGFVCSDLGRVQGQSLALIEKKMKEQLKGAGLDIFEIKANELRDPAHPVLLIDVRSSGGSGDVEVLAELTEQVVLKRNPKAPIILPTWRRHERLVVSNDEERQERIESAIQKIVDQFTAEFLANNPIKQNDKEKNSHENSKE